VTRRYPESGETRPLRGLLVAVCTAALTVTAHTLADGQVPHPWVTVLLTVTLGGFSTALAERTRGFAGVLVALGSGQVLAHLALSALSGHHGGGLAMTLSHAVATGGTAVVLVHAESVVRVALACLRTLLPPVWRPHPIPWPEPVSGRVRPAADTQVTGILLQRVHPRRGPPLPS
jgi:hypothetical protein